MDKNLEKLIEALELEKKVREAREDINKFTEFVFIDPSTLQNVKQYSLHEEIQSCIDESDRALILAPRGHGKTVSLIARVLFQIGKNRNERIKIICATDDLARKRTVEIREHIDRNVRLHKVFPELKVPEKIQDWTKTSLVVDRDIIDRDPSIEAAGILSSAVGGRASWLFFDDVVNYRNSIIYPALKTQVINSYFDVWMPLLVPKGKIVYIATPWTNDDLTALLEETGEYKLIKKPIEEVDGKLIPVCKELWDEKELRKKRNEIGEAAFNRAYKLVPFVSEAVFSLETLLQKVFKTGFDPDTSDWVKIAGVDLGVGQGAKHSYTVIVTVAYNRNTRERIIINIQRGHYTSLEIAQILSSIYQRYRHDTIYVESNSFQEWLLQWMASSGFSGVPVEAISTQAAGNYIPMLARNLAIQFDQNLWKIFLESKHSITCECEKCILFKELSEYPNAKFKDIVAALCIAGKGVDFLDLESSEGDYETWN